MIRRLVHRVLRLFGLVSARRHERLAREFAAMSKKYSQAKEASKAWEKRARQHSETLQVRLKSAQVALKSAHESAQVALKSAHKDMRRLEQANAKGDRTLKVLQGRREDVDHLRRALPETDRRLSMARDHLMAIEAKLDILEGAANVLDLRTRRHLIPTSD
jgi:hypothetical protein